MASPLAAAMKKKMKRGLLARQSGKLGNQATLGMLSSSGGIGGEDMANPNAILKALQGPKAKK